MPDKGNTVSSPEKISYAQREILLIERENKLLNGIVAEWKQAKLKPKVD